MADIEPTTEEQKASAAGTERASNPETFIPAPRVDTSDGFELATETRWLLQQRLSAASLVLVVGFGLFLARSFVLYQFESLAVFFYAMLLVLLIVCTFLLSSRWQPTLRQLRDLEIVLFALILILFMAAQYVVMLRGVREHDPERLARAVKSSTLWMVSFMFTYAIFIPNPWRRAARLIVPMALAPMTVP